MPEMDLNNLIEQTRQSLLVRLETLGLSPDEYEHDSRVLSEFTEIAAGQLTQEPGLEGPDPEQPIPLDANMVAQGLTLFCEGLYFALAKFASMGIGGTIKQEMIQNLALHIYEQAKQLVAATYGQEHTPEFQFTMAQQIDIIQKAAEGYLMELVTEYEEINGPIIPAELPAAIAQQMPMMPPHGGGSTVPSAGVSSPTKGPTPHDKYAAVALLLSTLPAPQRSRILSRFSDAEKELITYYSYPQHVADNLDLACVEAHLKTLKATLKKNSPAAKTEAYKGILALVESNPPEKLLSWVTDERPLVKRYLEAHYGRLSGQTHSPADGTAGSPVTLPPRIENILYQHLAKRLNAS